MGTMKFLIDETISRYKEDPDTGDFYLDDVDERFDSEPFEPEEVRDHFQKHYYTDVAMNGTKIGVRDEPDVDFESGDRIEKTIFCSGAIKADGKPYPDAKAQELWGKFVQKQLGIKRDQAQDFGL